MQQKRSLWQTIMKTVQDDGPLMTGVGRGIRFVVLNLCLLVCLLPMITGGAGWIALYTVLWEGSDRNFAASCASFFRAVRRTFKMSLLPWGITLLVVGGLAGAWRIILVQGWTNRFVWMMPLLLATAVIAFTVLWLYPLLAVSGLTWRRAVPAACLLGLRELGTSFVLLILEVVLVALALRCAAGPLTLTGIWLLCGVAPLEALKLRLMRKTLSRIAG